MPFIRVETNIEIDSDKAEGFVAGLSKFASAAIGKPEVYVTVMLHQNLSMVLSGKNEPAVFVTIGSILLNKDNTAILSEKFCAFMYEKLSISGTRVFIEFRDLERSMLGWDGRTF
ncbi:phenylpyruvate tautomerase MIF-related protein [Maridesulfovibrio frigidus]|uniref:phenylpyruvate tautomerase MIF-related protein n=1 Tax=Maridesulfovibrio frigidus TaxID=340956 RepID=UPI0004E27DE6|nr:phenylpyruvate tautomerase MIF-related protein [Maridesulfovibrio frigidus]